MFLDTSPYFLCECCGYNTYRKSDYMKHLSTQKHKKYEHKKIISSNTSFLHDNVVFVCDCGKEFSTRQSLHVHRKKCHTNPHVIVELIKDNRELREMLLEQNKTIQEMSKNNITISTNVNANTYNSIHKNTFNLNFFLNEHCKNAINMSDFVDSIEFDLDDLEETGRVGFVEGISKVVIKNLTDLNTNMRPIHCGDIKREVLYIKNDGKWEKEPSTSTRTIIKSAIQEIANKNMKKIAEWVKCHPDCQNSESTQNEKYLNIVLNSMSGSTVEEQQSNYDKIISRVAREVMIKKNNYLTQNMNTIEDAN